MKIPYHNNFDKLNTYSEFGDENIIRLIQPSISRSRFISAENGSLAVEIRM